jgi:hypothetical protein
MCCMEDKKQQLVNKVDSILQILLEELNSEKEEAASYREIHIQKITQFRGKIFASAAVVATLLTAVIALKSNDLVNQTVADFMTRYQLVFIIVLLMDLAIVGIAEYWFAKHIWKTRVSWFQLQYKYISAINHINSLRIFLATEALKIDILNFDQLWILIPYMTVSLGKYRIEIVQEIKEVIKKRVIIRLFIFNYISAKDIKKMLEYLCQREEKVLNEAYKICQDGFEKEKGLELPLDIASTCKELLNYQNTSSKLPSQKNIK